MKRKNFGSGISGPKKKGSRHLQQFSSSMLFFMCGCDATSHLYEIGKEHPLENSKQASNMFHAQAKGVPFSAYIHDVKL